RLAENDVEGEEVVERCAAESQRGGKGIGRVDRKTRAGEREVEGSIGLAHGARRRMSEHVAQAEILKEAARISLVAHRLLIPRAASRRSARRASRCGAHPRHANFR